MRLSTLIVETPRFRVRSYGNGLAYVLEHRGLSKDILFQGDDADTFRQEFERYGFRLSHDDALGVIWEDYAELSEPVVDMRNAPALVNHL